MYRTRGEPALLGAMGLARRELFAHEVVAIAKPYPDSQFLLERRGISRRRQMHGAFVQLNLYSLDLFDLPAEVFSDPEVNWHAQQLGRRGLIAAAGIFLEGSRAIIVTLQSDLCQQLYRHRTLKADWKTRIETHFGHWHVLLFNAVLDFCLVSGVEEALSPTGNLVVARTEKPISPALFLRIYDHPKARYICELSGLGGAPYWKMSILSNIDRIARLTPVDVGTARASGPAIAIFHDIEEDVDTHVSADQCRHHLTAMLRIEQAAGVDSTYSVLGRLMGAKRPEILDSSPHHSIGFHSYDHATSRDQLRRCREVDLRIRGYRPPRSRLTSELGVRRLTFFNFEWLASSASSLGQWGCRLENGLVKIPIHFDDYPLHRLMQDYQAWEARLFEALRERPFLAFGLHDCYAEHWLPNYPQLLAKLARHGSFITADGLREGLFLGTQQADYVEHEPRPGGGLIGRLARLLTR